MKTLTFTRPHSPAQLNDELLARNGQGLPHIPSIQPRQVEGDFPHAVMRLMSKGDEIILEVPDDADEAAIQAVVNAHVPVPAAPPPDFVAMMREIESVDAAIDFDGAATLAQLKTAIKTKFQQIERRQQRMIGFIKVRAGLK